MADFFWCMMAGQRGWRNTVGLSLNFSITTTENNRPALRATFGGRRPACLFLPRALPMPLCAALRRVYCVVAAEKRLSAHRVMRRHFSHTFID